MQKKPTRSNILLDRGQLGPYPIEKLKKVDHPTTKITDHVERFDQREEGFLRVKRGDFGTVAQKEWYRMDKTPILAAQWNIAEHHLFKVNDGKEALSKAPISENPEIISRHIKRLGYFLGADMVGICRLPQYAVYSYDLNGNPIELDHYYAIVILIDQEYETMKASNGYDWISGCQSFRGYSISGFIACIMANYIRRLGYPARAHHTDDYLVVVPPLILLAGLGEISRAGVVLNPFLGLRFKAAVVTTNLGLAADKPIDFGLQKFCAVCMKCAHECPSQTITTGEKTMYKGYETWRFNVEQCTKFRVTNPNGVQCGRCIKVCPWNKPKGWSHDLVRWMVKNVPFTDSLIVKMDDI